MFIAKTRDIKEKPLPLKILFKCGKPSWGGVGEGYIHGGFNIEL
jgi:hypothetical protein